MLKKPWEIENIPVNIQNKIGLLSKFEFYDDSKLIQSSYFKLSIADDFVSEIKNSQIDTGIIISNLQIKNILIYFYILDNRIFIINYKNLPLYQEYFNEHLDLLIFMTAECEKDFKNDLFTKNKISEQNEQLLNETKKIDALIKNEIIQCIIKKSQYRTIKMRYELLPDKYSSKNDNYYEISDFKLYYNSKDQIR